MPEITITDLYWLIVAVSMVGSFGHGFSAGAVND